MAMEAKGHLSTDDFLQLYEVHAYIIRTLASSLRERRPKGQRSAQSVVSVASASSTLWAEHL
jgi:hypothetical protein